MKTAFMSKDEARVQRSIASIMSKIEKSMQRTQPKLIEREKEFEKKCLDDGLIYFPLHVILYPSI